MNFSTTPPNDSISSADGVVVRTEQRLHVLGVEPLGPRREADEVDEDDADEAALLVRCLVLADERLAAREAEPRDGGVLLAAGGAEAHTWILRGPAGWFKRRRFRTGPVPGTGPVCSGHVRPVALHVRVPRVQDPAGFGFQIHACSA